MVLQAEGEPGSGVRKADLQQPGCGNDLEKMHFIEFFDVREKGKEENEKGNGKIAEGEREISVGEEKAADEKPHR